MEILLVGLVCLAALAWVFVKKSSKNDEFSTSLDAPYKTEPPVVAESKAVLMVEPEPEVTAPVKKARKPRAVKSAAKAPTKAKKSAAKTKKKLV